MICEVCGKDYPESQMMDTFRWCFECDDKFLLIDGKLYEIGKGFVAFEGQEKNKKK